MKSVNELLQAAEINHSVNLQSYATGVVHKIIAVLNRSDKNLYEKLQGALESQAPDSFQVQRLATMLASVRAINEQAYAAIIEPIEEAMKALAAHEAEYQFNLFVDTIPADIQVRLPIAGVSSLEAFAAATSTPFQGGLLKHWATSLQASRMRKIENKISSGYLEGQTSDQIVRGIRGTKALHYNDGLVLQASRREVEAVVRTALSHTVATAREEFYDRNSDLVGSVQWISTLDARTSGPCRIRDHKEYTLSHEPVGHDIPWLQGPGRIHWRCRSTSIPVTKSFRELGIDIDEIKPSSRASMDGQVAGTLDYGTWLSKQTAARQDEVVGPTRGKLMREGKLEFDRFYTANGQWIDLDQLKQRDASAFKRAGISISD